MTLYHIIIHIRWHFTIQLYTLDDPLPYNYTPLDDPLPYNYTPLDDSLPYNYTDF